MSTSSYVRRHIYKLEANTLFSTRDLLNYGKRATIDQCLCRLVKDGKIVRLARGLFRRQDYNSPLPSPLEVATYKAKVFGKQLVAHDNEAVQTLTFVQQENKIPTFIVSGRSSSFRFGKTIIHLKGSSAKKILLGNTEEGLFARTLWLLGKRNCDTEKISLAIATSKGVNHKKLRQYNHLLPAWLSDNLHYHR